ncbi:MAG: hypothetical protein J3K34DRAFT_416699 [Monoraphidium minutum]|nr:MAG: hypothetical protein J3K34DRAFT_416699 [Monoraphidium minutum]
MHTCRNAVDLHAISKNGGAAAELRQALTKPTRPCVGVVIAWHALAARGRALALATTGIGRFCLGSGLAVSLRTAWIALRLEEDRCINSVRLWGNGASEKRLAARSWRRAALARNALASPVACFNCAATSAAAGGGGAACAAAAATAGPCGAGCSSGSATAARRLRGPEEGEGPIDPVTRYEPRGRGGLLQVAPSGRLRNGAAAWAAAARGAPGARPLLAVQQVQGLSIAAVSEACNESCRAWHDAAPAASGGGAAAVAASCGMRCKMVRRASAAFAYSIRSPQRRRHLSHSR